jgi:multidrug transporter EmrE-like cation transporter
MFDSGYIYIFMTSFFTVVGELIIKWRIDSISFTLTGSTLNKAQSVVALLFDKYIMLGLFSAVIAALFWMAALSKFNLSFAYPMIIALLTILTIFASIIILGESLSSLQTIGVTIVVIGLVILWFAGLTV